MPVIKITVSNPFELHFDPQSQELTLKCGDTSEGRRRFELSFDADATRSLVEEVQTLPLENQSAELSRLHELEKQLESGVPLLAYDIDPPMEIFADATTGAVMIDCPCLGIGGIDHAGVLRLRLSPLAAKSLRLALGAIQTIHGDLPATDGTRSSH